MRDAPQLESNLQDTKKPTEAEFDAQVQSNLQIMKLRCYIWAVANGHEAMYQELPLLSDLLIYRDHLEEHPSDTGNYYKGTLDSLIANRLQASQPKFFQLTSGRHYFEAEEKAQGLHAINLKRA